MSLITIVWSMAASVCFTLSLLYLFVWCRQVKSLAYLYFSLCAFSIGIVALCELDLMFAKTPVEYARMQRWAHVPIFAVVVSLVAFVYVHLSGSLLWLGICTVGMRLLSLVLNLLQPVSINFQIITELRAIRLFGDELVAYPVGVINPLVVFGQLSSVILLLFVAVASIRTWRRGQKQPAVLIGGSICFFILIAAGHAALLDSGLIASPYFITMPFLGTVLVMGFELSSGLLKSARLGKQLQASQADLKQSENRLGVATDAAKLGLWTWDITNDRVWMNSQCETMIGVMPGMEIDLATFLRKVHDEDRDHTQEAVQRALVTCGDYHCEFRVGDSAKAERWLYTRGRIETSADGKPAYLHGACSDITQRRQSEERFRIVFESSPNGLVIMDPRGKILMANSEAERMFDYSKGELQGRSIMSLTGSFAFDLPVPRSGEPTEIVSYRKDGTSFPLSITMKPVRTSLDFLLLASMTDLTDRNEAERIAALQRSEITHLSRVTMLGEVTGSIAHELNQPLTAIMTNAETAQRILAKSPADTKELVEILREVVDDVTRAAEVIRLLRVLQKKSDMEYREVDLHTIISDVTRILKSEAGIRNVTVHLELAESLPSVRGDKVQLEQVVINLMLNAFDALRGVDISDRVVTIETSSDDDNMVHIAVKDSGTGIDAEALKCMFDPFFTSKTNGLGLGLAICKTIVEAHKGKLIAQNNEDMGATVNFSMPRYSSELSQELTVTV